MSRRRPKDHARLSKKDSEDLARALGDGFDLLGSFSPGKVYPLDHIADEPFWGAVAKDGGDGAPTYPDWFEEGLREGRSHKELLNSYKDYLDKVVSFNRTVLAIEIADIDFANVRFPWHWSAIGPFGFNPSALKAFFQRRFDELMQIEDERLVGSQREGSPLAFLGVLPLLSKPWLECHILESIQQLLRDSERKTSDSPQLALLAGKIGRMVEYYRWRYSYGQDIVRGRLNLAAAQSGGQTRKQNQQARTLKILAEMKKRVDKGEKVADAARNVFKGGNGKSAGANRQLWKRHQPR